MDHYNQQAAWHPAILIATECFHFWMINTPYLDGIRSTIAEWHFLWSKRSTIEPPRLDPSKQSLFFDLFVPFSLIMIPYWQFFKPFEKTQEFVPQVLKQVLNLSCFKCSLKRGTREKSNWKFRNQQTL